MSDTPKPPALSHVLAWYCEEHQLQILNNEAEPCIECERGREVSGALTLVDKLNARVAELERISQEYVEKTDPMLACDAAFADTDGPRCGMCRICQLEKLEKLEAENARLSKVERTQAEHIARRAMDALRRDERIEKLEGALRDVEDGLLENIHETGGNAGPDPQPPEPATERDVALVVLLGVVRSALTPPPAGEEPKAAPQPAAIGRTSPSEKELDERARRLGMKAVPLPKAPPPAQGGEEREEPCEVPNDEDDEPGLCGHPKPCPVPGHGDPRA